MEALATLIAAPRMGLQIALTAEPLPTSGFQLVQLPDRRVIVNSPFRIVEPINLHYGVAMISEDAESLRLHESLVDRLWDSALTGAAAVAELTRLINAAGRQE